MPHSRILRFAFLGLLWAAAAASAGAQERSYRLPAADLKQPVIWGSTCRSSDGFGLAFGGQDQTSADGNPHTRVLVEGRWTPIDAELRNDHPLQRHRDRAAALAKRVKDLTARARQGYFRGLPREEARRPAQLLAESCERIGRDASALRADLRGAVPPAEVAAGLLDEAELAGRRAGEALRDDLSPEPIARLREAQVLLERAADALGAEPPPRALSPLVFEPRSGLFVLFGGDHLDYLTNDLWVFDPKARRWTLRSSGDGPAPRANHRLKAAGDGKIVVSGGYTYAPNTDYMGGQYRDLGDGPWTCDLQTNRWSGPGPVAPPNARTYRSGPFLPEFFLAGPRPDAAAQAAWLEKLPANAWTQTRPPHLPQLNRDWGTAVLDPDRDLILRWSGGHCAHGGTDVLVYHLATNRWELPFPIEFPLGQLYVNTEYPDGLNFNGRPWVTGHTYQNYGYDPIAGKLVFAGRPKHYYLYDVDLGDWNGGGPKPAGMSYSDCFYTITICPTPRGLVAWTQGGRLFRFEAASGEWKELKTGGERLPGAVVDNSTVIYDSKRNRLLCAVKGYGERHRFDGQFHAVDLGDLSVRRLSPRGMAAAAAVPYLCQIRYDAKNDLMLVGGTLPPDAAGSRRTPAYDCSGNRWVSLRITGDDPNGKEGRNVSLGLMYDAKRKLFWAVDTHSRVYVLRLDASSADLRDLD